jgi:hypothetical protein
MNIKSFCIFMQQLNFTVEPTDRRYKSDILIN